MMALCPIDTYDRGLTGLESAGFFIDVGVLMILAFPVALIYILWRIFVPPNDLPGANLLRLDPENSSENLSGFCWTGAPIWKPILYFLLAVLTLIY